MRRHFPQQRASGRSGEKGGQLTAVEIRIHPFLEGRQTLVRVMFLADCGSRTKHGAAKDRRGEEDGLLRFRPSPRRERHGSDAGEWLAGASTLSIRFLGEMEGGQMSVGGSGESISTTVIMQTAAARIMRPLNAVDSSALAKLVEVGDFRGSWGRKFDQRTTFGHRILNLCIH
jgi:hypothetical protein